MAGPSSVVIIACDRLLHRAIHRERRRRQQRRGLEQRGEATLALTLSARPWAGGMTFAGEALCTPTLSLKVNKGEGEIDSGVAGDGDVSDDEDAWFAA